MLKWLVNFRANRGVLKALKKCMKTYERLSMEAHRAEKFSLEQFYVQALKDTKQDYDQLREKVLGTLSFMF